MPKRKHSTTKAEANTLAKYSTIRGMDMVLSQVHEMDRNILGPMYMINERAMEHILGQMVTNLKAFGKTMMK